MNKSIDILGEESSYTTMSPKEKEYFIELLKEEIEKRKSDAKFEQIRDIIPIEEWINSPYHVGPDYDRIYSYWKDVIVDVFDSNRTIDNKINLLLLSGCFTGDTKVSLLDGRELSFLELIDEFGMDTPFWVYSCDSDGNICPGRAHSVHKTKVNQRIFCVELDNGEVIRCTPDHRFMLRDGSYEQAQNLKEGQSLMPLYREYKCVGKRDHGTPEGYERVYNPADGIYKVTHKLVSEHFNTEEINEIRKLHGEDCIVVTHHLNFNKRDNTPSNLKPMECKEHYKFHVAHSKMMFDDPILGPIARDKMSKHARELWNNEEFRSRMCEARKKYANTPEYLEGHWADVMQALKVYMNSEEGKELSRNNIYGWNHDRDSYESSIHWREHISEGLKVHWNSEEGLERKKKTSERVSKFNLEGHAHHMSDCFWSSEKGDRRKEELKDIYRNRNKERAERILKERREYYDSKGITKDIFLEYVKTFSRWSDLGRALTVDFDLDRDLSVRSSMNTFLHCYDIFDDREDITYSLGAYQYKYKNAKYEYKNHKVAKTYWSDICEDVYDLEVDEYHNFALSSGVFVHNSIGIGKSTCAELVVLRKLYEMSCYRNINAMYNLMRQASIMFFYFSVNKTQAERTGFGAIRNLIDSVPYFNEYFKRKDRIDSLLVFPENIQIAFGSGSNDMIGMNSITSILDEANFIGGRDVGNVEKASALFTSIVNRSNSRFIINGGENHSLNILVSSATTENSVTELVMGQNRDNPHAYICAPAQWEVKPDKFSKKYFFVCKGTEHLEPHVVHSTDDINNFRLAEGVPKEKFVDNLTEFDDIDKEIQKLPPHLQSKFLKVPEDLRTGFETNIIRSLQDMGGVSTGSTGKLFTSMSVYKDCIDERFVHPFTANEIVLSTGDTIQIKDYLRTSFRLKHPERPRFIHIDQSYRTDSTGITCGYVDNVIVDEQTGMKKPVIGVDFMLRINPPSPPRKIAIYKIRNFIVWLGTAFGMKIGKVTYDIFNSEESRQILEEMGFNVGYQSVDRTDKAYLDLVEIMYEGRFKTYDYPIFKYELFNLVHYRDKRKVDHLKTISNDASAVNGSGGYSGGYSGKGSGLGSKDVSDSVAGMVENILQFSIAEESDGYQNNIDDFLYVNKLNGDFEFDAMSAEDLIDKQIDNMIEELEYGGDITTGYLDGTQSRF